MRILVLGKQGQVGWELQRSLAPLGDIVALGRADATALGEQAGEWGRYYEHHPVVLAGQMQPALRWLQRRQARGLDA